MPTFGGTPRNLPSPAARRCWRNATAGDGAASTRERGPSRYGHQSSSSSAMSTMPSMDGHKGLQRSDPVVAVSAVLLVLAAREDASTTAATNAYGQLSCTKPLALPKARVTTLVTGSQGASH